ncbi:hypothetical protein ZIOFF_038310 [Zingiber officinale]|uniref:Myb/SANT-like domain-containing protein n=1 Tax=Zingiber officinale TaxID=94328 RepID=A0A8J5FZ61_ZINOF|nr:hypothetical protein ZIOFF_038310 [Zingiber officinale]
MQSPLSTTTLRHWFLVFSFNPTLIFKISRRFPFSSHCRDFSSAVISSVNRNPLPPVLGLLRQPRRTGSTHDGRVLRDAISRPTGLKVPQGCYYLVDAGYCNSSGFLVPDHGHSMMNSNIVDGHNQEKNDMEYGRGKNKRFWTEEESWVLIRCLQDMITNPLWKTDGGFKNNYMNEIKRLMVQKLPQLTIEVKHIDSRIKFLKGRYHSINEMCKQSGCSWNDVEKKIACEFTWYIEWSKTHKDAKGLYNVSFPYFTDLDIVYGKDRATGDVAEDPLDAAQNLENADVTLPITDESDSNSEIEILSTMESCHLILPVHILLKNIPSTSS